MPLGPHASSTSARVRPDGSPIASSSFQRSFQRSFQIASSSSQRRSRRRRGVPRGGVPRCSRRSWSSPSRWI